MEFTRSRPYHSDDNAHVEQKNWTWARQLPGYGRLEDAGLVDPISALYREVWAPWQNFFLPCLKLKRKWREGSHWRRRYEVPRTAYEPLCHPGILTRRERSRLKERHASLDPFELKDELERLGRFDVNAVQALLLFNIGHKVMTAGELKSRGYYQGSNVSYNLKKLVEADYMDHQRSDIDRRSVRVRLTAQGKEVHCIVAELFRRHAEDLTSNDRLRSEGIEGMNRDLRSVERYWTEEIRYIY